LFDLWAGVDFEVGVLFFLASLLEDLFPVAMVSTFLGTTRLVWDDGGGADNKIIIWMGWDGQIMVLVSMLPV
jgi:hypothetical protein